MSDHTALKEAAEAADNIRAFLKESEVLRGHGGHILSRNGKPLHDHDLKALLAENEALRADALDFAEDEASLREQLREMREALGPLLRQDRGDEGQSDKHSFYMGVTWADIRKARHAVHGKPSLKVDPDAARALTEKQDG